MEFTFNVVFCNHHECGQTPGEHNNSARASNDAHTAARKSPIRKHIPSGCGHELDVKVKHLSTNYRLQTSADLLYRVHLGHLGGRGVAERGKG